MFESKIKYVQIGVIFLKPFVRLEQVQLCCMR